MDTNFIREARVRVPTRLKFGYVAAGVFDAAGSSLAIPPLFTSTDSVFPVTRRCAAPPKLRREGLHIWGGAAFGAFGHWLTETFPYLASLRSLLEQHPEAPVLMVLRPGTAVPEWGPLHRAFTDRMGFDLNRIHCVTEDVVVERLILPPDPFGRANRYRPATIGALDALGFAPQKPSGRALFLSRRKLGSRNDRTPNIAEIEETFASQGYEILWPETMSLDDQMHNLLGASHLAGENGSALHWSLFSPHVRSVLSLGWRLKLQEGICAARGQAMRTVQHPIFGRFKGRKQTIPLSAVTRAVAAVGPIQGA